MCICDTNLEREGGRGRREGRREGKEGGKEGRREEGNKKWRGIESLFSGMTRRGYLEWRNNNVAERKKSKV